MVRAIIQNLALLSSLLAPALAWAGLEELGACPDPEPLARSIMMCGQDKLIADKAQECSDKIIASWKAAAAELQPALLRASDKQNRSEADTKADYQQTIAALNHQIKYMQGVCQC